MLGVCFRAAIAKLRLQAAETTLKLQRGGLLTTQMSFAPTTTPIHTTAGAQVVTFASGARASECTYEQVKASETRRGSINRLLYRAKQRGFLELDIIIGEWAERHLPHQRDGFLASFSDVLDEENPELFKWLTGQEYPPPRVANNEAFVSLHSHVMAFLNAKSDGSTRAARGREWLRGWNDGASGNQ